MADRYQQFFNQEPTFREEEENDQESYTDEDFANDEEQSIYERDDKLGAI